MLVELRVWAHLAAQTGQDICSSRRHEVGKRLLMDLLLTLAISPTTSKEVKLKKHHHGRALVHGLLKI